MSNYNGRAIKNESENSKSTEIALIKLLFHLIKVLGSFLLSPPANLPPNSLRTRNSTAQIANFKSKYLENYHEKENCHLGESFLELYVVFKNMFKFSATKMNSS